MFFAWRKSFQICFRKRISHVTILFTATVNCDILQNQCAFFSSILIFCFCIYTKNCRFSYVNLIVFRMCIFLSVQFRTCRKILHSFSQRVKKNAKFFRKFWKCEKHKQICVSHFFTLKNSLFRKFSASCKLSC